MFEYSLRKRDNSKINEDTDLDLMSRSVPWIRTSTNLTLLIIRLKRSLPGIQAGKARCPETSNVPSVTDCDSVRVQSQ